MNKISLNIFLLLLTTVFACKPESAEHAHHTGHDMEMKTSENDSLYNEVMKIHDEVMPKMNDLHNMKQELKKKITDNPNMPEADKIKINAMIARLDSAGENMMVWMRKFEPLPDSVGKEKARAYLEEQMQKVKNVREDIATALEEAKGN